VNSNLKSHINILKQEGTSRYERDLPALDPETVLLDDRKLQHFIAYSQRYSKNVLFVGTDPKSDVAVDSWEFFFKQDIVLLIANIATRNIKELRTAYSRLTAQFQKEKSLANFIELVDYVFSLFQKLNSWYYSSVNESSLKRDLNSYIRSYLIDDLENLQSIKLYLRRSDRASYSVDDFKLDLFNHNNNFEISDLLRRYQGHHHKKVSEDDENESRNAKAEALRKDILGKINNLLRTDNVWDIKEKQDTLSSKNIFSGDNDEEKLTNGSLELDKIFEAVYHVIDSISASCNSYFDDTLNDKQNHPPHIALLIAFIKLYGYVQKELNKLPKRHLDYYYKEVLKIKEKNAIPDQVYVVFDLAKGFETGEIKKGIALTAGKDRTGVERIYEINEDVVINQATVASLNTIYIEKDNDEILNYYSNNLTNSAEAASDISATTASRKLFGEPKKENVAEIGFGIASTQFYLEKGERNVVITFELEDDIEVTKFDTSPLKLLLTGDKGWLNSDLEESRISINSLQKTDEKKLELSFNISIAQASSIVRFNKEIHSGSFKTVSPLLQCILKYPLTQTGGEQSTEYKNQILQLNVLQRLKIVSTSIAVQVGSLKPQATFDGVRDLILENHEAPLDGKKPFYPFTPMPKVDSSFYIGCNDLFYKDIKNLSINIEWLLPENFNVYYQNYLPPYDANKFRATLSILKDQVWKKIEEVSIIDIETKEPKFRSIKLDFDKLKADNAFAETSIASFDNTRKNYTLRLKLNYPDFGHTIYPQLITSAVIQKASSKSSSVDYYAIVKKELRDSAISIKLPDDLGDRNGSMRVVVYDILDRVVDVVLARVAMVKGLSKKIKEKNGSTISLRTGRSIQTTNNSASDESSRVEVNDDNIIERFYGLLKRIKLISQDVHYDEDRQSTIDVVEGVKEKVNPRADFIMPTDRELESIIFNETNNAIDKTVGNIVDQLLKIRKAENTVETGRVAELIKKEFDEANEVINDMIAHKIAILLSANEVPPPPYTPLINKISISYSSVASSYDNGDQFFYITPFGVSEIDRSKVETNAPEDPSKNNKINYIFPTSIVDNQSNKTTMEGMLFIGLKDVVVNQNLSLLIQLTEGAKVIDKKPPNIIWWYRRKKEWARLEEDYLISDSTFGLQTTGIIKLSVPADAANEENLFGVKSLFWFCASVLDNADLFPMLVDIKTQAAVATFKDQGNDPQHLALPLEAEQIKGLVNKVPFVKAATQPVSSFGGKPREQEQGYYVRTSERLRHKARAINNWDYERIVLENFPSLYKVKCLNNYYLGSFLIGHVTIVPITDLQNKNYLGNNILLPKTNYLDLRNIEKFLSARASPFVKIHAVNPQLDQVVISCKVKFRSKVDKGFSLKKLNKDLVTFLSPWASGDMETLSFSSKIYASSIINFIDKREYVDYVKDFAMQQYTEKENGEKIFVSVPEHLTSLEETVFTTGHSILVSAIEHDIQLIE
jgi:hypothetical protein